MVIVSTWRLNSQPAVLQPPVNPTGSGAPASVGSPQAPLTSASPTARTTPRRRRRDRTSTRGYGDTARGRGGSVSNACPSLSRTAPARQTPGSTGATSYRGSGTGYGAGSAASARDGVAGVRSLVT